MRPPSRVALVVQRYGPEVNGGAEQLARRVARLLADDLDLTVLTTCALDYRTWANHYPAGEQDVEGVRVRALPGGARARRRRLRRPQRAGLRRARATRRSARRWMEAQGPDAPGPGRAPARRGRPLRRGRLRHLPLPHDGRRDRRWCADRALLVPTLHDEPPARLAIFRGVFDAARALIFSTEEERELARERFGVGDDRARVAGLGPRPRRRPSDPARHGARSASRGPTRSASGASTSRRASATSSSTTRATGAPCPTGSTWCWSGGGDAPLPAHPWLHRLGFVEEPVKHDALAGAAVVVLPSPYESLSLVQLEAWSHGRPTLANAASPVLVGQSRRSGGGLWYRDGDEYARHARPAGPRAAPGRTRSAARGGAGSSECVQLGARARGLARGARARRRARARPPARRRLMAAVLSIYGLGSCSARWPASRSPGCSTRAGAGSASRPSRSGSASWSPCSTRWARSWPGSRAAPVALGDRRARARVAVALRLRGAGPGRPARRRPRRAPAHLDRGGRPAGARRSSGFLMLAPDDRAGLRDDHRRDATTTAGATRPWSTGSRTTRSRATSRPNLAEPLTFVPWDSIEHCTSASGSSTSPRCSPRSSAAQGFEVVNAAAAVGLAAAVGGWATLAAALRPRLDPLAPASWRSPPRAPSRRIPFVENYTTQFVSICLWPFAVAAFVAVRGPTRAGGGWSSPASPCGGVVGVYPAAAPWLVLPWSAIALLAPDGPVWAAFGRCPLAGPGLARRAGRAVAAARGARGRRRGRRADPGGPRRRGTCSFLDEPAGQRARRLLLARGLRWPVPRLRLGLLAVSARPARLAGARRAHPASPRPSRSR